ncbi:MAG: hypothetical protein SCM11_09515 [Bacillota bacterium]|nr:hypothetical protein [Bacillota bacterium]
MTADEATAAKTWLENRNIDFVLILSASFAAGETFSNLAHIKAAIGLWAIPEPSSSGEVPLNSFCSINMQAGILKQYYGEEDIKYKWYFGWTDNYLFRERLLITLSALRAIKNLRGAKIALVGGIAPGFNDLYYDERIAHKYLGVTIERNITFEDVRDLAMSYPDREVAQTREDLLSGISVEEGIQAEALINQSRFLRAYREIAQKNDFKALAISCWPKMQDQFGLVTCAIMGRLNEYGIPSACEGDVPGALSQLFLFCLSGGKTTTLLDLVAFDQKDDSLQLWHCGPGAPGLADECGTCLRQLTHCTSTGSQIKLPSYHDMAFQSGPVTIARFTNDWQEMMIIDGNIKSEEKERFSGSSGWLYKTRIAGNPVSSLDAVNTIFAAGFQHHYPLVYGNWAESCLEASYWLGIKPVNVVPYENWMR